MSKTQKAFATVTTHLFGSNANGFAYMMFQYRKR